MPPPPLPPVLTGHVSSLLPSDFSGARPVHAAPHAACSARQSACALHALRSVLDGELS